jgi:hypothetical protein
MPHEPATVFEPQLLTQIERRGVHWSLGFATGLISGLTLGQVLVHLPGNRWLGPYPAYEDMCSLAMLAYGLFVGPLAGAVTCVCAEFGHRWWCGRPAGAPHEQTRLLARLKPGSESHTEGTGIKPDPDCTDSRFSQPLDSGKPSSEATAS